MTYTPPAPIAMSEPDLGFALTNKIGLSSEEQGELWDDIKILQEMAVPHERFAIWIDIKSGTITLMGDLDGSTESALKIDKTLSDVSRSGVAKWIVCADQARVFPPGVMNWIEAVDQYLENNELLYRACQLGLILKYDDDYRHRYTVFDDE